MSNYFDDMYTYYRRSGLEPFVPGMVRMDRALLYLRQRLRAVIRSIEGRTTKSIGDGRYLVVRLAREASSLGAMGGDRIIAEMFNATAGALNHRMPRRDALKLLEGLLERLESYEPQADGSPLSRMSSGSDPEAEADFPSGTATVDKDQLLNENSVFVIMPFAQEFTDVWKGGIDRAAQAKGFKPIRVDMINRSTNITDDIVASIEKCHLAIVDVTGNNPNVMFELGYTMAKDKKNIIISQSADFLPFDIRNIRTIVYQNTWSGIEELKKRLEEFLGESKPAKSRRKSRTSDE
jgi:nucleoside 2-deoxyribosyltransferase